MKMPRSCQRPGCASRWVAGIISSLCCTGCLAPTVEPQQVLGSSAATVHTIHYHDFLDLSPHGEQFDFQELAVESSPFHELTRSPAFAQAPDYSGFRNFYKSKLLGVRSSTWRPTPLDSAAAIGFQATLRLGNLQEDAGSRDFLRQHYLTQPGNFYAYFTGYPEGTDLYVLVPATKRLFIIRNRG